MSFEQSETRKSCMRSRVRNNDAKKRSMIYIKPHYWIAVFQTYNMISLTSVVALFLFL